MKYCGIKRIAPQMRDAEYRNFFNPNGDPYQSLGDRIKASMEYGADIGSPAVVQYDAEDTEEVDILTDPNHDFFDIAEHYQQNVQPQGGVEVDTSVVESE